MLTYPNINPVAISIGPLKIHWYGLMYLAAFVIGWLLGRYRAKQPNSGWHPDQIGDLLFYIALGVILGGRLGYVLFYDLPNYLQHPLNIFKVWQGGMSFHGGLIGVIIAMWLFGRKINKTFFQVSDFVAPLVPLGYGAGRIGNFINGELWGKVTDVPWGMVFPNAGPLPRHPSQLYQAFLGGVVLFIILWLYSRKPRPTMAVSGLFLLGFGIYRTFVEFFRQPDAQIGYLAWGWLTEGQVLSAPMIVIGAGMMWWAYKRANTNDKTQQNRK
jgi:phosphatidylglycerol:prolipoprotein diacylglycerol transferase